MSRRDKTVIEEVMDQCKGYNGETIMEINTRYDEEILKQLLIDTEGSRERPHQRGIFIKWYGTISCVRGSYNEAIDAYSIEHPGDCDEWGSENDNYRKRVFCRVDKHRNCYNHEIGDRGRYTYNGRKSTSITEKTPFFKLGNFAHNLAR